MMKKLLKSVVRTVPEMLSVLLLLAFHLYFFTMIGMLVLQEKQRGPGWLFYDLRIKQNFKLKIEPKKTFKKYLYDLFRP